MYLGICQTTGLVYEGLGSPETPSIPTPCVTQAKLIENESDWQELPRGISNDPIQWIFREDSFDPVTRIRRGRIYEPAPGAGQPGHQGVTRHPYDDITRNAVGLDGRIVKSLYTYWAGQALLNKPRQGQGLMLSLGNAKASSGWRIIQTEVLANGAVMLTLKSLSSFAIIPSINLRDISAVHRPAIANAIEKVLDSAFRESPVSVVDQCRAALTVLLSRWLVQNDKESESVLKLDLGALAKKLEKHERYCVAKASEIVALLHSRGKPNVQHEQRTRPVESGDDVLALESVSLVLREFGWAIN